MGNVIDKKRYPVKKKVRKTEHTPTRQKYFNNSELTCPSSAVY